MRLYIIRHGKAHKDSPTGLDSDRELRPRGELQARWLGAQLAERDGPPAKILTSPFARAYATASLINESLDAPLHTESTLEVGNPAEHALNLVRAHADTVDSLVLVGHNPQLEALAAAFAAAVGRPFDRLRTGEAYVFDLAPGGTVGFVESLRLDDAD